MSEPTREQQFANLSIQIGFYMTSVANQRYYSTPESCVSYLNSNVLQYKAEAEAYNAWRDACWLIIVPLLDSLQPEDPIPTIEQITAQLPVINWP